MNTRHRTASPARRATVALATALAATLAMAVPAEAATANGGGITINHQGPASPYPSTVDVSGLTGVVSDVQVTLTGLSHTIPSEVVVALVGPGGQAATLMSRTGWGATASDVNLTFSATAARAIDMSSPLTSGTYLPSDAFGVSLPAPAPALSDRPADLGVFRGTDPNGPWRLYVYDTTPLDSGSIASWSLDVTTVPLAADAGGPYTVTEGGSLTLEASGNGRAPGATFAWDLDGDGDFDDAVGSRPTVAWTDLAAALGTDDGPAGPFPIGVQLTVGTEVVTDSTTVTLTNGAPYGWSTAPTHVAVGRPFDLELHGSDASATDLAAGLTFEIDWDGDLVVDQTVPAGAATTVSHTYTDAGTHDVFVWATDKDGDRSGRSGRWITAFAAAAGGPYTVVEGGTVQLDASGSTPVAGATYAWDLDGDGVHDDATGPEPVVTWETLTALLGTDDGPVGPFPVSVAVSVGDDGATTSVAETTLTITDAAPTVSVDHPEVTGAGVPFEVLLSATDPSTADVAAGFGYEIDWDGDGVADVTLAGDPDAVLEHTYAEGGTYEVTVWAVDQDGARSEPVSSSVHVVAVHAGGPYTIREGGSLTLGATNDPIGTTVKAGLPAGADAVAFAEVPIAYAWDLDGDGDFDDAVGAAAAVDAATLAELGLGDGPLTRTIRVRMTAGDLVSVDVATLTVTEVAPTVTVGVPAQVVAGTPTTLALRALDPSAADRAGAFAYEIDWDGDGKVDERLTGTASATVSHTFTTAGTRRVTVWATDKDGARGTATTTAVTVVPGLAATGGAPLGVALAAAAALALGAGLLGASRRLRLAD